MVREGKSVWWIILSAFCFLPQSCSNNDDRIIEGGCVGEYYLENESSYDLFVLSAIPESRGDTIAIPKLYSKRFGRIAGFNTRGEPWYELYQMRILRKDSGNFIVAYEQTPLSDTLWDVKQQNIDDKYCLFHYTLVVTNEMLE